MNIPPANDPIWTQIITGKVSHDFAFSAARLLKSSLSKSYTEDPSDNNLRRCCGLFRELFVRNRPQPLAQRDLHQIIEKAGHRGR